MEKQNFTNSTRNGGKMTEMRNDSAKSGMVGMYGICLRSASKVVDSPTDRTSVKRCRRPQRPLVPACARPVQLTRTGGGHVYQSKIANMCSVHGCSRQTTNVRLNGTGVNYITALRLPGG